MMNLVEKILPWGPLAFGILIFAPMWAAALDALGVAPPYGVTNLALTLVIGIGWGIIAKQRGQWL